VEGGRVLHEQIRGFHWRLFAEALEGLDDYIRGFHCCKVEDRLFLRVWTEFIERNLNLLSSPCLSKRGDDGFIVCSFQAAGFPAPRII